MFVLVRHADAGDKHRWADHDGLRPLSEKGRRQAGRPIASLLESRSVTRLLSSPAVRCLETLSPASRRLGLEIEARTELAVGGSTAQLLRLLESPEIEGAALCTHGETLTALSRVWQRAGRLTFVGAGGPDGLARTPKGASWIIEEYHGTAPRASSVATHRLTVT